MFMPSTKQIAIFLLINITAITVLLSLMFHTNSPAFHGITTRAFAGGIATILFQIIANMVMFRYMSNNNGVIKLLAISGKISAGSIIITSVIFFVLFTISMLLK